MKLILAFLILMPMGAMAAPKCGAVVQIMTAIRMSWGEVLVETQTRPVLENAGPVTWQLWVNPKTKSWTLTGAKGGVMCLVAAGRSGYDGRNIAAFFPSADTPT